MGSYENGGLREDVRMFVGGFGGVDGGMRFEVLFSKGSPR